MSSVTELWQTWQEGFANKDSSKIGELFADDFVFTTTVTTRSKQETLAWVDAGGNPTVIDNLEVLYENDEVGVIHHSANNNNNDGVAIAVYTKTGGKISQVRVV